MELNDKITYKRAIVALIIITIVNCIIAFLCLKPSQTTSPVEEHRIDYITKENDKLIIEVEHLDSIKNAKVIEVKNLDNDSTLRLFYELIRK